jgi:hypothetical protein
MEIQQYEFRTQGTQAGQAAHAAQAAQASAKVN